MDERATVSVVMPFYNTPGPFLVEAIESVLAQTCVSWELILVDDGSTNESTGIARQYADRHPGKVRYLEHPGHANQGAAASRQLGINQANGKYIAFLDADDVWLPHKLKQQVAIMESQPEAAMLYGNTQYWHSWTGAPQDRQRDFLPELGIQPNTLIVPPALLPLFLEGKAAVPPPCSVIVRRDVVNRVGGFADIQTFMFDDQMFYARVCLVAPVFVSGECWDRYRQHPDSGCAVADSMGQQHTSHYAYLEWLADYLSGQGVTDPEVWQALRRQLWLYRQPRWSRSAEPIHHALRRGKKWLLRIEERILPSGIRRRLWVGNGALS